MQCLRQTCTSFADDFDDEEQVDASNPILDKASLDAKHDETYNFNFFKMMLWFFQS